MTLVRSDLESLPPRLQRLPVDERGYPIPWFVAWVDGKPEFRAMDGDKFIRAVKEKRCWVCGDPLGRWLAFPIGPMCAITRTTAEPPMHVECAEWSIRNCPFLSQPQMVRRAEGLPDAIQPAAGHMITRNPGVICLWITREYEIFNDGRGKPLLTVGKPERVSWWCEGRAATRVEVENSVQGGLPILLAEAKREGSFAVEALGKQTKFAEGFFPSEIPA